MQNQEAYSRRCVEVKTLIVAKFEDTYAPGDLYEILGPDGHLGWLMKIHFPGKSREYATVDGRAFYIVGSQWSPLMWETHSVLRYLEGRVESQYEIDLLDRAFVRVPQYGGQREKGL